MRPPTNEPVGRWADLRDGTRYPLNDVEAGWCDAGDWYGTPAVIVRLQGCEIGCASCNVRDTASVNEDRLVDTWLLARGVNRLWTWQTPSALAAKVRDVAEGVRSSVVIVTGGEPTAYNLEPLVHAIRTHDAQWTPKLILETAACFPFVRCWDYIVASPKRAPRHEEHGARDDVLDSANEIRVLVDQDEDVRFALSLRDAFPHASVMLRPTDNSPRAERMCAQASHQHGLRLAFALSRYIFH